MKIGSNWDIRDNSIWGKEMYLYGLASMKDKKHTQNKDYDTFKEIVS
jgi:hypothetical protein